MVIFSDQKIFENFEEQIFKVEGINFISSQKLWGNKPQMILDWICLACYASFIIYMIDLHMDIGDAIRLLEDLVFFFFFVKYRENGFALAIISAREINCTWN